MQYSVPLFAKPVLRGWGNLSAVSALKQPYSLSALTVVAMLQTMSNNILIVENDPLLQKILQTGLEQFYHCTLVSSVARACSELELHDYSAVILDRVLDDGDGIEVVTYLRDLSAQTRVLIISMLDRSPDKIHGLASGADDYLAKPFSMVELKLRIEKLLSSTRLEPERVLRGGPLELHTESGVVVHHDQSIQLRKKESQILACLLQYRNRTVRRETLCAHVWPAQLDRPQYSTLDVYIRRLRMALRDAGQHIKTARGFGYQFCESPVG